jgi:hypothetical protein
LVVVVDVVGVDIDVDVDAGLEVFAVLGAGMVIAIATGVVFAMSIVIACFQRPICIG